MTSPLQIPFGRPWITDDERQAVLRVLDGPILTHGPECKAFEEEFARFLGDGAHCVTVSSCMAALHLAYLQLGIGPGDEVVVPAQTHTATAHAVEWVGATPVFVDCDPQTGNITAEAIVRAVTPRTRAISVVHFVGIPCDMPPIVALARERGLKIVEDCALAVGARVDGRHVGLFGDVGCFSFYPAKHITTGEGGMVVSRHPEVAASIGTLRAFGVDRTHAQRSVPGMYDVPTLGLNYRMSEIQAAIGRVQVTKIPEILTRRRASFERLRDGLAGINGIRVLDSRDARVASSHYCLSVVLTSPRAGLRDAVVGRLGEAGIGTSMYYPHPVPRLRYYRDKYGYDARLYPAAEAISDASVALPVAPHVSESDVDYMADTFRTIMRELGA
jgi:dTDP-4-amino-4,6-dideoxygalactose transaminase